MGKSLVIRGFAIAAGLAMAMVGAAASPASAAGTAGKTQAHSVRPLGAFYAEVINRNSGKCVNLAHQSGDNGAWIQQYHCDNTPAAKFLFTSNSDGYYEIQNQSSRKCVDIEYGGWWDGARTQQFNCNGSFTQQWKLNDLRNGYYSLINRYSSRCLDVPYASTDDSVVLNIWSCVGGHPEQEFRLNIG
jgi:hypothetical protein